MILSNVRTDSNFTFGQFSVVRKLHINGGAIRPTGFLFVCSFFGLILINFREMDLIELFRNVILKVGKLRFGPFSHNLYDLVLTKCCPNVLHHVVASLLQSCPKI